MNKKHQIKNESRFKQHLTKIFAYIIGNAHLSINECQQLLNHIHTFDLSKYEEDTLNRLVLSYIQFCAIDDEQDQNLFVKLSKSHDQAMNVFYYGTQIPKYLPQLVIPIAQKVCNKQRNNSYDYLQEGTYFEQQRTDSNTKDKVSLKSNSKMSSVCNFIGKYIFSNYMKVPKQESLQDSEPKRQYFFKIKKQ